VSRRPDSISAEHSLHVSDDGKILKREDAKDEK